MTLIPLNGFTPQKQRYAILSVFLINLHQELIDRMGCLYMMLK